ncbi:MAG: PGPGW domain-containing protein [Aeromicrobium sp.]
MGPMQVVAGLSRWMGRFGAEALGWLLIPVGVVLMPAPGPGLLIVVAGVALLSRRHPWARRLLDPLRRKAVEAARYGVATWPRIALSLLGVAWLVGVGIVWWSDPDIPEFSVLGVGFGPSLPAAGWVSAVGLWVSAAAALGLLVYSIIRWRNPGEPNA